MSNEEIVDNEPEAEAGTDPLTGVDFGNITLPSGRVVAVEELLGIDQQALANKGLVVSGRAPDQVLARRVAVAGEGKKDEAWWRRQLEADRLVALLYLRLLSFGPSWDVVWTCPECEHKNAKEITITREDLDKLPTYPKGLDARVSFDVDGKRYQADLFTGDVTARMMKDPKAKGNLTARLLARRVLVFSGPEDKHGRPYDWNNSTARQNNAVAEAIVALEAKVDLSVRLECDNCGHAITLDPLQTEGFLFPGRKR